MSFEYLIGTLYFRLLPSSTKPDQVQGPVQYFAAYAKLKSSLLRNVARHRFIVSTDVSERRSIFEGQALWTAWLLTVGLLERRQLHRGGSLKPRLDLNDFLASSYQNLPNPRLKNHHLLAVRYCIHVFTIPTLTLHIPRFHNPTTHHPDLTRNQISQPWNVMYLISQK